MKILKRDSGLIRGDTALFHHDTVQVSLVLSHNLIVSPETAHGANSENGTDDLFVVRGRVSSLWPFLPK